jgi:hypothetical protein
MSSYSDTPDVASTYRPTRRISTETKAAFKTTEIIAYVVVAIAVLVASQISDQFAAKDAWFFVTLLTIGYMVSRGLAKSGSRDFYDDEGSAGSTDASSRRM